MNNFLSINGKQSELTEDQARGILEAFSKKLIRLADIAVGDTFKIGDDEWVALEHSADTTAVIRKGRIPKNMQFGKNNNAYDGSIVDGKCSKVSEELASMIGAENIIEHMVDLTSNDGLKDYGKIKRKVSLLTADLYRRYVDILDKYKLDDWWWLATPYSTSRHNSTAYVLCVSPSGYINFNYYNYSENGVRPFCILKSNIFVSK